MQLTDLPLIFALIGPTLYTVLGGANFGAGFWQLTAGTGSCATRIRDHKHNAMAPVWEANHVWLIFVLTVVWTAYPAAFGSIASTLTVPLFVAAVGIIFRGASYALRSGTSKPGELRVIDIVFALSSILTPFALGTVAGGIASCRAPTLHLGPRHRRPRRRRHHRWMGAGSAPGFPAWTDRRTGRRTPRHPDRRGRHRAGRCRDPLSIVGAVVSPRAPRRVRPGPPGTGTATTSRSGNLPIRATGAISRRLPGRGHWHAHPRRDRLGPRYRCRRSSRFRCAGFPRSRPCRHRGPGALSRQSVGWCCSSCCRCCCTRRLYDLAARLPRQFALASTSATARPAQVGARGFGMRRGVDACVGAGMPV
jgi:Cytochrome bd terminal oxidase subunit II